MEYLKDFQIKLPFQPFIHEASKEILYERIISLKDEQIQALHAELMEAKKKPEKLPVLRYLWENYYANEYYWIGLLLAGVPLNLFTKGSCYFFMSETGYSPAAFWKFIIRNYQLFHSWLNK